MDNGESTTQISVTKDSKEAEVLCLLQTYWDEANVRLSTPSTYAKKIISLLSWKDRVARVKFWQRSREAVQIMGKWRSSFLAAKPRENGSFSAAKQLSHEQKLICQLRGQKIVGWLTFVHHDSIQQPGSIPVNIWVIWRIKKRPVNSRRTDRRETPLKMNYTKVDWLKTSRT